MGPNTAREEDPEPAFKAQADEAFQNALLEGSQRSQNGLIPLKDTTTFNLNPMLLNNVSKSPYFVKKCVEIEDWTGLVDEIYYQVKHVEPWTLGECSIVFVQFLMMIYDIEMLIDAMRCLRLLHFASLLTFGSSSRHR